MDPLLAVIAELWWIGPASAGAGALGWAGLRGRRSAHARHLELAAAKHDLRSARDEVTRGRAEVTTAQAELARAQAERSAHRVAESDVAAARRALHNARQQTKAALASLRARRAGLRAARATVPRVKATRAEYPLAKLVVAHNAVLARWMEYETDPAKLIAFPTLSDGRSPVMAVFLRAQEQAQWLRPTSTDARMTPADFSAYREAVRRLERAFEAAEHEAWRQASDPQGAVAGAAPGTPGHWSDRAQEMLLRAQRAIDLSSEAVTRVTGATTARRPDPAAPPRPEPAAGRRPDPAAPDPAARPSTRWVWPVPSRGTNTPPSSYPPPSA